MASNENIRKLAEMNGKGESRALLNILEHSLTDDEAGFILNLPAPAEEVASKSKIQYLTCLDAACW